MPASLSAVLSTVVRYSIPFGVVRYCLRERERERLYVQAARSSSIAKCIP
jgi:hypothetical protein